MKNESNPQFAEVQRLLAYKRLEMPSDRYFDGVLFEFHQRQRAALLKPVRASLGQMIQGWWSDLVEVVSIQPARALRYAMGVMVSVGLLGASLNMGRLAPSLASSPTVQPAMAYAFAERPAVESADYQIDSATLVKTSFDSQAAPAHYVLNDTASLGESIAAF